MSLIIQPPGFKKIDVLTRTLSGIDVRYIEKYPIAGQSWVSMRSDRPSVLVRLSQRGGLCEPRLRPDQPTPRNRYDVGFFNWIPANSDVWCFSDNVQFLRDLQISFDAKTLTSIVGEEFDLSSLTQPQLLIYEPRVTNCARMLADMFVEREADDQLYGDGVMLALLASIITAVGRGRPETRNRGLSPWQLRLAKEFLEDNFNRNVSLEELANQTGLSRSWFARSFRGSTGIAPYSFVLQIRIRRAKELLRDKRIPIAAIATQVGFADQSHFTKVFRRYAGTTPHEWRGETKKAESLIPSF